VCEKRERERERERERMRVGEIQRFGEIAVNRNV
jgi:hypothetical protein